MDDVIGQRAYERLDNGRRCMATSKATGERCKRAPIVGGFVCAKHGGSAPQVRQAARQRLLAMVDDALNVFVTVMKLGPKCEHCGRSDYDKNPVVLQAAKAVLDRCGLGPQATLNVSTVDPEHDFSHLSDDEIVAELEQMTLQAKASVTFERPALSALPEPAPADVETIGTGIETPDIWVEPEVDQ